VWLGDLTIIGAGLDASADNADFCGGVVLFVA
jgi:hypothetical protein